MKKLIENFTFELLEPKPLDYDTTFPDFCNAYICACISQLCYKGSVRAEHTDDIYKELVRLKLEQWGWSPEDAKRTVFINSREITNEDGSCRPGTQGLIVFYKETAIIGFRGSEKKFNGWFTDFNLEKVEYHYAKGKVHRGFSSAFNAVLPGGEAKPLLEQLISDLRSAKAIWLTGHSLGGAIASVAASYLLHPEINIPASRIYVYTFGAPRVGDGLYREDMNHKLTYRYWRFVHKQDVVADVPLPQIFKYLRPSLVNGFAREGSVFKLDDTGGEVLRRVYQDGTHESLNRFTGITARDHGIQLYRDCLLKLIHQKNPAFPKMTFENLPSLQTTNEDIEAIETSIKSEKKQSIGKQLWHKDRRWQLGLAAALAFVLIIGVCGVNWSGQTPKWRNWASWTGFGEDTTIEESVEKNANYQIQKRTEITKHQSGKTLWDWLGLLAVPVLLVILGYQFQRRDQRRVEEEAQAQRDIADENSRHEALQVYIDRMSELLLDQNLIGSNDDDPIRDLARARTLTILRRLRSDAELKARVLYFLNDAGLLKIVGSAPLVNLVHADFGKVNMKNADLSQAYMKGAYLGGANLEGANLEGANLEGANLEGANLEGATKCTPAKIKAAKNWQKAHYSPDFRQELGLLPEPSKADNPTFSLCSHLILLLNESIGKSGSRHG